MIEAEYIYVTNLTKLRIADRVIRDCLFNEDDNEYGMSTVNKVCMLRIIGESITRLEKKVIT